MTLTIQHRFKKNHTTYTQKGKGEPLVLLHGVGMRAEAWSPQIEFFSKEYLVIAPDMPGHGDSAPLPIDATIKSYVNWAIDFIESLELGPVNLAGHSMGSLITLGVAATKPELVKRIAILNGVYKRTDKAREAVIARAKELESGEIDIETPLNRWFNQTPTDQIVAKHVRKWLSNININGYKAAYTAFAKGDLEYANEWSNIYCPTLVLTGELDPNSTPEMAKLMAEKAKNAMVVIIRNERHMVNLTSPTIVNKKLTEWLNTTI